MVSEPFQQNMVAGRQALSAGDWQTAYDRFQLTVDEDATAEALEALATAAWWLDDAPVVFECRERAYRLYRQSGDQLGAARVATWLGVDHYLFRAELAVANGWLQHAQRLLAGTGPSFERCWLALMDAHILLFEYSDTSAARRIGAEVFAMAETLDIVDMQVVALALEGLALVSQGNLDEGMRKLDESTAVALSGQASDPDAITMACCYLIYACDRVRDFDRAWQWCEKVEQVSRRWAYHSMFAVCRTHYAGVLFWRGDWASAERELTTASRDLKTTRLAWVGEAVYRLAELRRRQGRLDEADALAQEALGYPLALLCRAEIALECGDNASAADLVERYLRRIPLDNLIERAAGWEVAVRVHSACGAQEQARSACAELEAVAGVVGTTSLYGSASFARGLVELSTHQLDAARRCFEDAVDAFQSEGAPFEMAQSRMGLATALAMLGRHSGAGFEARAALATFEQLGAERDARRATTLLEQLESAQADPGGSAAWHAGMTRREVEVLGLLARGYSNPQIADRLFISVRTVERHISGIYAKLGAEGRAARAVATAYAIEHGLAHLEGQAVTSYSTNLTR